MKICFLICGLPRSTNIVISNIKELFKLRHFKELKPIIRAKLFISKELKKIMEQKQEEGRRRFAIRRIERNPIYQYGLGDKLRRKAYEAEF